MITIIDIKRELHRKSFYHFVKDFWHTVEAVEFIESNLMRYLCDIFQFAIRNKLPEDVKSHWISDKEYAKVIKSLRGKNILDVRTNPKQHWNINMPPRHAKSLILNIFASVWLYAVVTGEQTVKVAGLSHTSKLANEMNDKKQQIINSEEFKAEFGHITTLVNQSDRIIGSNLAEIYSVSMDKMTGRGLNYAILDDLVTAQTAVKQQEELRNALRFMQNTLPSRMNKSREDAIINIAQRLGPGDVSEFIMDKLGDLYQTVKLQALAEEDITIVFPCSGETWTIKQGESLFPERFTVEDYLRLKEQMGDTNFENQYQQNSTGGSDTIIKESMLRYMNEFEAEDILRYPDAIYASHDLPVNDKKTSDMHGALVAYKKGSKLLIADAFERHYGFVDSQRFIKNLASSEDYRGIIQLIENKANGAVVIQTLQSNVPGIVTIEPGSKGKVERLKAASSWVEAGNVYFLTNRLNMLSPELQALIKQITSFPYVKHDDMTDAFSQLVNYVFVQKQFGLFDKSISEDNFISEIDIELSKSNVYVGVIREGFEYAMLKVAYHYNSDTFYVIDEKVIRTDDMNAIQEIKRFSSDARIIIDATKNNILYNSYLGRLRITNDADRRTLNAQIAQINMGLITRRIKFSRNHIELRSDLDRVAWDVTALANGEERLKDRQRLVACLRTILYFIKGDSEFY